MLRVSKRINVSDQTERESTLDLIVGRVRSPGLLYVAGVYSMVDYFVTLVGSAVLAQWDIYKP